MKFVDPFQSQTIDIDTFYMRRAVSELLAMSHLDLTSKRKHKEFGPESAYAVYVWICAFTRATKKT